MKVLVLGKTRKGTLDFQLKSEDELGFNIQAEDKEGLVYFFNVLHIRWIAEGRIVYLDQKDSKPDTQYSFAKCELFKVTKATKISEKSFEHHYFK
nr:hypothetical protein [Pedobacter sp. ASV19]